MINNIEMKDIEILGSSSKVVELDK